MPPPEKVFDIIERHGVVGPPGLLKIYSSPGKQLSKLYEETFHAIYDARQSTELHPESPLIDALA